MYLSAVLSISFFFSLAVSQRCPEHAQYSECGCLLTCDNPIPSDECAESCQPGCYCRPGYLYRNDGACVPHSECEAAVEDGSRNNDGNKPKMNGGNAVRRPPQSQCPENSVLIPCGSACAPTCADPRLRSCVGEKCVTACYCYPGFLTSRDEKRCVRPEHCDLKEVPKPPPPQCPEHSIYIRCGSACPPTCHDPYPKPCNDDCATGCFCEPGYLLNVNGTTCVRPDQCEKTIQPASAQDYSYNCTENAIYQECGTMCPPTCEQPNPQKCSLECATGCFCKPGFLKRKDGKCVPPQQCQGTVIPEPKCVANAVFIPCGSSCPPTCESPKPRLCSQRCVAGCFCKPGYLQTREGTCVLPNQCAAAVYPTAENHSKCYENEVFNQCGTTCPETCENRQPAKPCTYQCVAGCFCKPGFVRNRDGKCVPTNLCEKICSLPEEEYKECGSTCPDTCANKGRPSTPCPRICVRGCFCKKGLFRNDQGACVALRDCPSQVPSPVYEHSTAPGPQTGVTFGESRGCPNQKLCEAFCKTHKLNVGYCVGKNNVECHCA